MATRSVIAFRETDEQPIRAIYCHWDGSPDYVGRILHDHYQDVEKVRELIDLGDLSSLGETIGEQVGFDDFEAHKGQCVAYGRDRGEDGVSASAVGADTDSLITWSSENAGASYVYFGQRSNAADGSDVVLWSFCSVYVGDVWKPMNDEWRLTV